MGKTVLITGANRGIGLELVREFAGYGWKVFACCRTPESATALSQVASGAGGTVSIHRLDVTDPEQIRQLAATLSEIPIDILVNNAGVSGPLEQDFGNIDTEAWLQTFHVNTIAPMQMAVAFADQVARSRRKVIITIGSLLGSLQANEDGGIYAYRTSKAAAHLVMKNLAIDLAPKGITAVALHPGWVRTEIGGPEAPLSPRESAVKLHQVLTTLTLKDSGKLWSEDGQVLPW